MFLCQLVFVIPLSWFLSVLWCERASYLPTLTSFRSTATNNSGERQQEPQQNLHFLQLAVIILKVLQTHTLHKSYCIHENISEQYKHP